MAPLSTQHSEAVKLKLFGRTSALLFSQRTGKSAALCHGIGPASTRGSWWLTKRHSACQAGGLDYFSAIATNVDLRIWGIEIAVLTAGLLVWSQRPRGWSSSAVEVEESPVHGRGLFAVRHICAGETIGAYPGLVRNSAQVCT
jgi:hypothetical protein